MRWCKLFFVSCVAVLQHASLLNAQDATTTKPDAASSVVKAAAFSEYQTARGQAMQKLLVRGIDFAREHGDWPQDLAELKVEKSPAMVYLGPPAKLEKMDRNARSRLRAISPVCHESFKNFPDGVWVGYADGHIEMVRDAAALRTALDQFKVAGLVEKSVTVNGTDKRPAQNADARLLLKFTDDANRPVAGAQVGHLLWNSDHDRDGSRGKLVTLDDNVTPEETTSNAEGQVEIRYPWFFNPDEALTEPAALVVYQKDRGLMAIVSLPATAFERPNEAGQASLDVKLQHTNAVEGSFSLFAAPLIAGEEKFTNVEVFPLGGAALRPLASMSTSRQFHFQLPPGDYLLHAYGENSFNTDRYVHVEEGAPAMKFEIDLPADALTSLVGKPAPELRGIKAWQNGKATTLADLRGKWVLVDFWGYWCGPCVQSMPDLMKLHDDFGDKGLAVVTVHDDSVESIEEMQKNLARTKAELWKGRDLPFFVALDGGGELPISGTERSVKGSTHAAYGIQHWPTTVLIDPNGIVLGERDAHSPELRKFLEEKLNTSAK
jgi:thiol-disulfide isomerase/thioredoxin